MGKCAQTLRHNPSGTASTRSGDTSVNQHLIALFHQIALGLQVVIEGKVHSGAQFAVVIAVRLG